MYGSASGSRYRLQGMTLRTWRFVPLLLLSITSCKKEGGTPAFVRIIGPEVRNAAGTEVIPSAITDFWVYANDQPVGVWQADRRIPVLASGTTNIKVIAGVRKNGITDARIQYNFLETYSVDVALEEGKELTLEPVFRYYNDIATYEDFEETGVRFDFAAGDTSFVYVDADTADVISGERAGAIVLDAAHPTFVGVSIQDPPFNNGVQPAFLELDLRSDTRLLVGAQFELNGQEFIVPSVFLSPTAQNDGSMPWRHVYIDLGSLWGNGGSVERQFYFRAALENGATSARIVLDNIRVVY